MVKWKDRALLLLGEGSHLDGRHTQTISLYTHAERYLVVKSADAGRAERSPLGMGTKKTLQTCVNVTVDDYKEVVPYCMHIITPEDIIRRIELYNIFYDDDRKRYSYDPEVNKTAPKDTQVVSLAK